MVRQYIDAAMRHAKYEVLPEDSTYYGEIIGFDGVYANAETMVAFLLPDTSGQGAERRRRDAMFAARVNHMSPRRADPHVQRTYDRVPH